MAYTALPCACPSSLQLRVGFSSRTRGQLRFLVWAGFSSAGGARIRLRAAAESATARGGDVEDGRGLQGSSWEKSNAVDSFSGWDGSPFDESKHWGKFGGTVGAGLAGILLVAAAIFGALSLKQKSSGQKQQMLPLTADQEKFIASDENETAQTDNKETANVSDDESTKNGYISDNGTGKHRLSTVPREANGESTSESSPDDSTNAMSLVDNVNSETNELVPLSSNKEGMLYTPHADGLVPETDHLISPDIPVHNVAPETISDTEGVYSNVNHIENNSSHEASDLPSFDLDSTSLPQKFDVASENQKTDNFQLSTVKSSSVAVLLKESASLDTLETPKSDAILDLKVEYKAIMGAATSVSEMKDLVLPEEHYLPDEGISSAPHKLFDDKEFPHGAAVPSSSNNIHEDVSDMVPYQDNDANKIISEPSVPENSFSSAGIPAPSLVSAALQVSPGKVVIPAVVDQVQGQALAALQVLKVIDADALPGDLCSRREYARWLVSGSSILSRSVVSKVYPAMYIENVTELAFDDVTPEDPDFSLIQGLAEAGLISSKLSIGDISNTSDGHDGPVLFSPESPLSRQDLVSWKMALEKRELPDVDRKSLYMRSGFLGIDKIHRDAWPALMADLSGGDHGIITLAFGYTRLFQPDKPVTKAQAAIALATGEAADIVAEELTRIEAESMAEAAVAAHNALVADVEREINMEFAKELEIEREKITTMEKLAEEARLELERLRAEREREKAILAEGRAAVESEKEILARLRHDAEEQLEGLMSKKTEILFERERIDKLRKETESESQAITQLHYDLEVEKKALSMARAWAEEEAKKARHQAKELEEARSWWERQGLKVIVDDDLREDANVGTTWVNAGGQEIINENIAGNLQTIERSQNLVDKLKEMAKEMKQKSSASIQRLIQKIQSFISFLRRKSADTVASAGELKSSIVSRASLVADEVGKNTSNFRSTVKDGVMKAAADCREGLGKLSQKFKT